jgi:transcriptional regulator with XRE-family HTH domain
MGRRARLRPERLAEKLRQVRLALGLSQSEMLHRLGFDMHYSRISEYELGKHEPALPIILRYARIAGVYVDTLIDDEMDLPKRLRGL